MNREQVREAVQDAVFIPVSDEGTCVVENPHKIVDKVTDAIMALQPTVTRKEIEAFVVEAVKYTGVPVAEKIARFLTAAGVEVTDG